MLSSVLRSERAVLVNIEIMRAFVKVVFDTIRELMTAPSSPRRRIGFVSSDEG